MHIDSKPYHFGILTIMYYILMLCQSKLTINKKIFFGDAASNHVLLKILLKTIIKGFFVHEFYSVQISFFYFSIFAYVTYSYCSTFTLYFVLQDRFGFLTQSLKRLGTVAGNLTKERSKSVRQIPQYVQIWSTSLIAIYLQSSDVSISLLDISVVETGHSGR